MPVKGTIPNPLLRVVLLAAYTDFFVPFLELSKALQDHVALRLAEMVENDCAATEFEKTLVELNPSPDRVQNHFKWRATQPVRVRLRVPRFHLEMDIVRWVAGPEAPQSLTNVDLSGLVYQLRAASGCTSVLELVDQQGIDRVRDLLQTLTTRVRMAAIRSVILSQR